MPTCTLLIFLGGVPFQMLTPPSSEMPLTDCESIFAQRVAPSLVQGASTPHTPVDIEADCGRHTGNKCKGRASE